MKHMHNCIYVAVFIYNKMKSNDNIYIYIYIYIYYIYITIAINFPNGNSLKWKYPSKKFPVWISLRLFDIITIYIIKEPFTIAA